MFYPSSTTWWITKIYRPMIIFSWHFGYPLYALGSSCLPLCLQQHPFWVWSNQNIGDDKRESVRVRGFFCQFWWKHRLQRRPRKPPPCLLRPQQEQRQQQLPRFSWRRSIKHAVTTARPVLDLFAMALMECACVANLDSKLHDWISSKTFGH